MLLFFVQAACNDIFGCITPPVNIPESAGNNPAAPISGLFTVIIRSFITLAAIVALAYLLWGAFDWITSGGEKEKIMKAQQKITYAIIGILCVVVAFSVFAVIAGNMLGIVQVKNGTFIFNIPHL